jgi:hypothetical protein
MNICKVVTPLISIFVLLWGVSQESQAVEPRTKAKPPCRIQISHAHISRSVLETNGYRAVKVDAFSKCNVPQSNVTLRVEIWKKGAFGNIRVARTITRSQGTTNPGRNVENFNTWRRCTSFAGTSYFGIANAKAFIQGTWQFAGDTYSLEIKPLACGT